MEIGKYTKKPIDLSKFDCSKFPFTLYDVSLYGLAGCGYNLLASLVGKEDPFKIRELNKNKDSCEDKFIIKYLSKNGFKILPITKCLVSNRKSSILNGYLKPYNVIISSNLVKRNEASWFAKYQRYWLHNQEITPISELDMLNFPLVSAFLIYHNKYK